MGQRDFQAFLRSAIDGVPAVVFHVLQQAGGEWRVLFVSKGIEQLFGISADVAMHDPGALINCILPDDRGSHSEAVRRASETHSPWMHEHRIRTASGQVKWVRGHAVADRHDADSVLWHGIMIDITDLKAQSQALADSRELFSQFMENLPAAAFIKNDDGTVLYMNRYLADLLGDDSWPGKTTAELFPPALAAQMMADDLRALGTGSLITEEQVPAADGRARIYQTHKFRIARQGQHPLLGAIALDITERRMLDEHLKASEAKYRALVETTATGYLIVDGQGRVIDANPEYVRLTGHDSLAQIFGRLVTEWTADYERQKNAEAVAQCAREGTVRNLVIDYVRPDQQITTVEINATTVGTGEDLRIIALCRDITERRQIEQQVRELAFYDALTRLPNRRLLHDRLGQTLIASKRSGRSGALLLFDLDDFKLMNDRHGHAAGDLLLAEVAARARKCVRESDTVARFGGDEFVVILSELDTERSTWIAYAGQVAERIRSSLAEPYQLTGLVPESPTSPVACRCTVSIGIAMFISDVASQDEILRWADLAMYQAKDAGGNQFRFYAGAR